jgi:hypothetical protein
VELPVEQLQIIMESKVTRRALDKFIDRNAEAMMKLLTDLATDLEEMELRMTRV